ncbi:hypothetical protein [Nocardioides sp.]|uniref:hypothetical protein n=1 Tax=Nocardioides sp. TaxID=35761 RepID=UPI002734EBA7|nr:hypothetical protein [Nocardioides sp.]MDP3893166.1 hypothetical protein [Nocardioides sp.]
MQLATMPHRLAALVAVPLALLLTGCAAIPGVGGDADVLDTGIAPVELAFTGPTYAVSTREGLLLRTGDDEQLLPGVRDATWLPNGTVLVETAIRPWGLRLADPAAGRVGPRLTTGLAGMPSRSVTQVNLSDDGQGLVAYTIDGQRLWKLELPETDNPDATDYNELARSYYGATPTLDGVTFNLWHDSSEWYEDGDYGVVRIEDGAVTNVAMNERLIALYLAADGSGLLALRQAKGEPCGGCNVNQEIVELDPETGDLHEYGTPQEYTKEWRVAAMDKVGDRVAVRFTETEWRDDARGNPDIVPVTVQRGTWVYDDGDWSMVEGSDDELTWWQGEDRVVARVVGEPESRDGFDLFWIRPDGTEESIDGELTASFGRRHLTGQIPGQLLPPLAP